MPAELLKEALRVLKLETQSIQDCINRLESNTEHQQTLTQAIESLRATLDRGGKIIVTGVGKSGKVGQKIAATLSSTGSLSIFLHPTEGLHGDLGVIVPGDAVLVLSYSGNTEELVKLLPALRDRNVRLIGLGGNPNSRLASSCDLWIDASVAQEACPHGLAPTTSTTLTLAMGDAIAMALMKVRGFERKDFASNHPGGALGKRLSLRVKDLMIPSDQVGTVHRSATMDEVVICSTKKKQGAVIVVQDTHLEGIITDGDLRRALSHREKFFTLAAEAVMTRNPITADLEMRADQALRLMEERESQISVLPVTNAQGHWKGLLRLHDLVRTI